MLFCAFPYPTLFQSQVPCWPPGIPVTSLQLCLSSCPSSDFSRAFPFLFTLSLHGFEDLNALTSLAFPDHWRKIRLSDPFHLFSLMMYIQSNRKLPWKTQHLDFCLPPRWSNMDQVNAHLKQPQILDKTYEAIFKTLNRRQQKKVITKKWKINEISPMIA